MSRSTGPVFVSDIPVSLPAFNPGLGTLVGETLTMNGFFTPGEGWAGGSTPAGMVPVTLAGRVGVLPSHASWTSLATENAMTDVNAEAFGTAEAFTVTGAMPAEELGTTIWDVWAVTVAKPGGFGNGYLATADLGTLGATLIVSYDYLPSRLPEPATLPLLAIGVVGLLAWCAAASGGGGCTPPSPGRFCVQRCSSARGPQHTAIQATRRRLSPSEIATPSSNQEICTWLRRP